MDPLHVFLLLHIPTFGVCIRQVVALTRYFVRALRVSFFLYTKKRRSLKSDQGLLN